MHKVLVHVLNFFSIIQAEKDSSFVLEKHSEGLATKFFNEVT